MADENLKPRGGEVSLQDLRSIEDHIVPAPQNRWVLLHIHIFKNAGSTIEHILSRVFGRKFATLHGPDSSSVLNGPEIEAFLAGKPELAALSSHHIRYPKPRIPGVILFDICFFRDPLQRLWSMYKYQRRIEAVGEFSGNGKVRDAQSFFEELLEQHPHIINDVQVNVMANRGEYTRPPTEADLCVAIDTMRQISVLGVVELFDESAMAAEYFLRPTFPALQFQYVKQNADPASSQNLDLEVEKLRREVGPATFGALERMNKLDTELVAHVRKEVSRRFEMLPNREVRVADFRERCRILQSEGGRALVP